MFRKMEQPVALIDIWDLKLSRVVVFRACADKNVAAVLQKLVSPDGLSIKTFDMEWV